MTNAHLVDVSENDNLTVESTFVVGWIIMKYIADEKVKTIGLIHQKIYIKMSRYEHRPAD